MEDTATYVFYTLFPILVIVFFKIFVKEKRINNRVELDLNVPGFIIPVLFYTLIIGLRYNVGRDYAGYTQWYKELKYTGNFPVDNDFGFVFLNKFLVNFGFESYSLFIVIAFLQILFLMLFLKSIPFIRYWYLYFFFTSLLFFVSMNAMRQTLAFLISMYCIQLLNKKNYYTLFLMAILALSIHKTVSLLFILLPVIKIEWFKNVKKQIVFFLSAVFILPKFFMILLNYLNPLINLLGYNYYMENLDMLRDYTEEHMVGEGLSVFLFFFIDFMIIIFYNRLKESFKKYYFIQYYNLFFIGVILSRMFKGNFILERISDYFIFFRLIILSFLMLYIFKVLKKSETKIIKPIALLVCIAMLLFYYRGIYNNAAEVAPIQFIFYHD
ncbi:EpsG family protein [Flavobacterium sp. DG2-3]|uniref:EpsG family protein n=1 Tax=Flavobacterium sp. DG2-3 TaxID=3068317 RepID=UPI00273E4B16|nr:EpsG family protein [Flavobacterium sp. DG2-3]MDP5199624.1 EpsG family protein [Flavobacterium sp. DG2-3]